MSRPDDIKGQDKAQSSNRGQVVPRVELIHSPPVDWDLGAEGEKEVATPAGEAEPGEKAERGGTITQKQRDEFMSEQRQTEEISAKASGQSGGWVL